MSDWPGLNLLCHPSHAREKNAAQSGWVPFSQICISVEIMEGVFKVFMANSIKKSHYWVSRVGIGPYDCTQGLKTDKTGINEEIKQINSHNYTLRPLSRNRFLMALKVEIGSVSSEICTLIIQQSESLTVCRLWQNCCLPTGNSENRRQEINERPPFFASPQLSILSS